MLITKSCCIGTQRAPQEVIDIEPRPESGPDLTPHVTANEQYLEPDDARKGY